MTLLDDAVLDPPESLSTAAAAPAAFDGGPFDEVAAPPMSAPIAFTAVAALLSSSAAAWLVASLLRDAVLPKVLAVTGAAIGVGIVAMAQRARRRVALQFLVLPAAGLVGAIAISPVATGGTANLPGLVAEALRAGGLLQPPIPFDPGWRFLLIVLLALVGAVSTSLSITLRRPKLAVAVPLPLIVGAALFQPAGREVSSAILAMALLIGALAVADGGELIDTPGSRSYELRRLSRASGLIVILALAVAALARTDFLFPATDRDQVIPPRRPPAAPPEPDRELFVVDRDDLGPWRVGVLDTYDGEAWLLPPADPDRAVDVEPPSPEAEMTTLRVADLRGRSLPVPAGLAGFDGKGDVELDPRTGVPHLPYRVPSGYEYSVSSSPRPGGRELNQSPVAPASIVDQFVLGDGLMPPPPAAVTAVLVDAPDAAFDRLQYVRDRLYANVIAAGAGSPTAVTPARVAEMISGPTEATPFEITAAEALLARWSGVPARIGYGYYGGDPVDGGLSLRPRHGSAWLEAYFTGHGWVPLLGTPPQAKPSESSDLQNQDPRVQPSDELGLSVHIPVERPGRLLLFEIVRYWLLRAIPLAALAALAVWMSPALAKVERSIRRSRWARRHGASGRLAVAYAELRDRCSDLNLGSVALTPLEFASAFDPDDEQAELAWLVTRGLWGDLRRDLRVVDAELGERLARSVQRRIEAEQPLFQRILAWSSRSSLTRPWSEWPPGSSLSVAFARVTATLRHMWAPWRLLRGTMGRLRGAQPRLTLLVLLVALVSSSCATTAGLGGAQAPVALPDSFSDGTFGPVAGYDFVRQSDVEGAYASAPDRALVTDGQFFSVRRDDSIEGSLQVMRFRPDVNARSRAIHRQIEASLGGSFTNFRVGTALVRQRIKRELRLFLWFPPERNVMVLLTIRANLDDGDALVTGVVASLRGLDPARLVQASEPDTAPPGGAGLLHPVAPGQAPAAPTPTPGGGRTCPGATFRTTARPGIERDGRLTLIPPGVAPEGIDAEARVTVRNDAPTEERFEVSVHAGTSDGPVLGRTSLVVGPRRAALASVTWSTAGRTDVRRVAYSITGAGTRLEGGEDYSVAAPGGARAERRLRAVWLDPLGLSTGVYPRRCPVSEGSVRAAVDAIADLGATSIVVTYAEYLGAFFYPSSVEFFDRDVGRTSRGQHFGFDLIGTVLSQADRDGIHVFIGLGRSGDTELIGSAGEPDHKERRQHAIDVASRVADDLWSKYGGHGSLYGWYMTHEANAMSIVGPIYDPVARHLDQFGPDKPVLIAPTGNPAIDRDEVMASETDIFAYQDAVGAGYDDRTYTYDPERRMVQLEDHYRRYAANHAGTGKHLWADLELWEMDGSQGYSGAYPASFSRVRRQLEIAADHVEFVSAYEFAGFLDQPDSPAPLNDRRAAALYLDYQSYRAS